jgi:hypothetical protein
VAGHGPAFKTPLAQRRAALHPRSKNRPLTKRKAPSGGRLQTGRGGESLDWRYQGSAKWIVPRGLRGTIPALTIYHRADPCPVGIGSSETASACAHRWGRFFWRNSLAETASQGRTAAAPPWPGRYGQGDQGAFSVDLRVWSFGVRAESPCPRLLAVRSKR